mmetsp:Transcript_79294/g.139958  ORF Transcript_79294/g.139958 Transcript_79294/m.139958 type:complete len:254 (-) Transcript_79294:91-852(-)
MALWASSGAASKVNLLMVCMELGKAGLRTAQAFGKQFQLSSSVLNGYVEQRGELPSFGQLGCQGFVVLGPYGEFAVQRTVPCYLEAEKKAFRAVEKLLSSLWSISLEARALPQTVPAESKKVQSKEQLTVGVPEMDEEHEAIQEAVVELTRAKSRGAMESLMQLWVQHSEHEEQLFYNFDFGSHRSAAKGRAATAPHCEHHRLIARMMGDFVQGRASDVDAVTVEIQRHMELYDAAYAGKLKASCDKCCTSAI